MPVPDRPGPTASNSSAASALDGAPTASSSTLTTSSMAGSGINAMSVPDLLDLPASSGSASDGLATADGPVDAIGLLVPDCPDPPASNSSASSATDGLTTADHSDLTTSSVAGSVEPQPTTPTCLVAWFGLVWLFNGTSAQKRLLVPRVRLNFV
jgi:hypothetical protein